MMDNFQHIRNLCRKEDISLYIGDKLHTVNAYTSSPETSLNSFLREELHKTGTKRMCLEGGCGSCIVAVVDTNTNQTFAVNSCLVSILSCHGWQIFSIEGIGSSVIGYHPLQNLLAERNGSQCGFCSPGMVMSMYALSKSGPLTAEQIENSFGGNICRCTGYRPILEAFKTLASERIADIEDLPVCQKTKECERNFWLQVGASKWVKVYTLADLLQVLGDVSTQKYMLVGGNTSQGVYPRTQPFDVYIDVSKVVELTRYSVKDNLLTLGGNMSLNAVMACFRTVANKSQGFTYLSKLADHIDLVANVPVRNIGTLAETVKATLVIVDTQENEVRISPADFLSIKMTGKIIKEIILTSFDNTYKFGSFKIMPKAQNSHALVNAAFLFKLSDHVVQDARMVFGNINKDFVHATRTETLLQSANLFDNNVLQKAYETLEKELKVTEVLPEPPAAFRQQLAISLFYKYVLSIAPQVPSTYKSGATVLQRPLSQGHQEYTTIPKMYPVSKPIRKLEALYQTAGEAEYIADIPDRPGQLYASFVLAKVAANTRITNVDPSEALKLKGVVGYFDKNDIPGRNTFTPLQSGNFVEEELFCSDTVLYFDQPVGIIVAESYTLAETASDLVKITYSASSIKPLLTIREVLKSNDTSRVTHQTSVVPKRKGTDIEHVIKGEMYIDRQYHMHMEVQCCNIVPVENGLEVYASTQWMDIVQMAIATVLNIPTSQIDVFVRRLGGGFGAKITRNPLVSAAASIAAHKLKRPVKMWLSLRKNMRVIGKRFPFYIKYEVGVNNTGVIQYLDADLYSDFGIGGNDYIDSTILEMFPNIYNSDTWNFSTYTVKTDTHANCWTRAPGTVEGLAGIEHILEHVAQTLNLDPTDVRLANIGDSRKTIMNYYNDLVPWADIKTRKQSVENFNRSNRWKKRGLTILPLAWTLEVAANYNVLVSIFHGDGGVAVIHSGIEIGQGINTKVAQVVAYKLGVSMDLISVKPSYSAVGPNSTSTGGSLTSEAVSYAALQACDILNARIKPVRDKMKNASWTDIINRCYTSNVFLSATAPFTNGDMPQYQIYAVCAAEVEVDILTGQHQVLRYDVIEDVGDSMNPAIDIGQLEGAVVMGIGYFTSEEIVNDEKGELLTDRTWNYSVPGPKDIPVDFRIKFPGNNPNPVGVLHSKAIGEPPMCLTFAVPLAIRWAVADARQQADSSKFKWYPVDGCSTVSNTFLNTLNDYKQYTL